MSFSANPSRPNTSYLPVALVVSALYFSQGLPSGFIAHALPALLREAGASLELIGLVKLVALPWVLKFLWAPWVDRQPHFSSRRRRVIVFQLVVSASFFTVGWMLAENAMQLTVWVVVCLFLINLSAASQDVATDAITVSLTPARQRGLANSIQVVGYKVGMIAGGAGILMMSDLISLAAAFSVLSLALLLMLLPLLFKQDTYTVEVPAERASINLFQTYKGFMLAPQAMLWLVVLLTYKTADSLGSDMLKPLLVDLGYTRTNIGEITFSSSLVGMAGAFVGGLLYRYMGLFRSLMIFGLAQTIGVSSFYWMVDGHLSYETVLLLVSGEQFVDGLSTVALFAGMMDKCREFYEGADYTLQMCIQLMLAGVLSVASGFIAGQLGYHTLFITAGVIGCISLIFVALYARQSRIYSESVGDSNL